MKVASTSTSVSSLLLVLLLNAICTRTTSIAQACEVEQYFCNEFFEEIDPPIGPSPDYDTTLSICLEAVGDYNIRDLIETDLTQDLVTVNGEDSCVAGSTSSNPRLQEKVYSLGRLRITSFLSREDGLEHFEGDEMYLDGVVTCGFGRAIIVDAGTNTKPAVPENSGYGSYPVTAELSDITDRDQWESVVITYSTPSGTNGAPPQIRFGNVPEGVVFTQATNSNDPNKHTMTLTGPDRQNITDAMLSLQIRPGEDNGEDITVHVKGIGYTVGTELKLEDSDSFVIPVDPVISEGELLLEVIQTLVGYEDSNLYLTKNMFLKLSYLSPNGDIDNDGSEQTYLEILDSSIPRSVQLFVGSNRIDDDQPYTRDGYHRIPSSDVGNLWMKVRNHYSGNFTMTMRAVIEDATLSGTDSKVSDVENFDVMITPRADSTSKPKIFYYEDGGPVNLDFGAKLAQRTQSGVYSIDTGLNVGNNDDRETISQFIIRVPFDTDTLTFDMYGTYVPADVDQTLSGAGSAMVLHSTTGNMHIYQLTSTIITEAPDLAKLSQEIREQAEADILATLTTFMLSIGPEHVSLTGGELSVTATTLDVNIGYANTRDTQWEPVVVSAMADKPGVNLGTDEANPLTVTVAEAVAEDTNTIPLYIKVYHSADTDGSESLSVKITVPQDSSGPIGTLIGSPPAGVQMSNQGNVYTIQATLTTAQQQQELLNSFLSTGSLHFDPRPNFSGVFTGNNGLQVDVISTELDTVSEYIGVRDATVSAYIGIVVTPTADAPVVSFKGNARGYEFSKIEVPISVQLGDTDGSESYNMRIDDTLPQGSVLFGAGNVELEPVDGKYALQPADVNNLFIRPPEFWSSPLQGDITLRTEIEVSDSASSGADVKSFPLDIPVYVIGVAQQPNPPDITIARREDEDYEVGAALDLDGILVDKDGSEQLYLRIAGVPGRVIPSISAGSIRNLGSGQWQVDREAIPGLTLPPVKHYSGDKPLTITVWAISQELDTDEALSDPKNIKFEILPVADGFSSWAPTESQVEADLESSNEVVSLKNALNYVLADDDGSEEVTLLIFDLGEMISAAGIGVQLGKLSDKDDPSLDDLIPFIAGDFEYSASEGTLKVLPEKIAGISFSPSLFLDSNQDFDIPVSANIVDTAFINGERITSTKTESDHFKVNLKGTADVPTVFAESAEGAWRTRFSITLGGESTDRDVELGRTPSESMHYVARTSTNGLEYAFVNENGAVVGLAANNGGWVLRPQHLQNLNIIVATHSNTSMAYHFDLTSVATENDGDQARNGTDFTITVLQGVGGPVPDPLDRPKPPIVTVDNHDGLQEDNPFVVKMTAVPDPADATNPTVSVVISNFGACKIEGGATYDPSANAYVVSAEDLASELVKIVPPKDFSGDLGLTFEAIASTSMGFKASTGTFVVDFYLDPVSDGPSIKASHSPALEDEQINIYVTLSLKDKDGSEQLGEHMYLYIGNDGATMDSEYDVVQATDGDVLIAGKQLEGYMRIPVEDVNEKPLALHAAPHWHGIFYIDMVASSLETYDDADGDHLKVTSVTHAVEVTARADPPDVTAENVIGDEDTEIPLVITASLVDDVTTNGEEILSVVITDVPEGSIFKSSVLGAANNGDGSWVVPPDALGDLSILPPLNYAGTMYLNLKAIAKEKSNGDEAISTVLFTVNVRPVADSFLMVAKDCSIDTTGFCKIELNLRMDDTRGTDSRSLEIPEELITLNFTNVPDGIMLIPGIGGKLILPEDSPHVIQFSGTESQANSLSFYVDPKLAQSGSHAISMGAQTHDGTSFTSSALADSFMLNILQLPTEAGVEFHIIGADQDSLTGGNGQKFYRWDGTAIPIDSNSTVDSIVTITDFDMSSVFNGGDILDFSLLFDDYNPQLSKSYDFVEISFSGNDAIVSIDMMGSGSNYLPILKLLSVPDGTTLDQLLANGNILI